MARPPHRGNGDPSEMVGVLANGEKCTQRCAIAVPRHAQGVFILIQGTDRPSREQVDQYNRRLDKHERSGYWYGQSTAGTVYILATVLERVDNDFLWSVFWGFFVALFSHLTSHTQAGHPRTHIPI